MHIDRYIIIILVFLIKTRQNMHSKIKTFEDLTVWQKSMDFVIDVYKKFNMSKDYNFKDQLQRASVSIPANISEGFERHSNKEFIRFLYIARGSYGECRTLLILSQRLKTIEESDSEKFINKTNIIHDLWIN
jgi:four helix bundle protein